MPRSPSLAHRLLPHKNIYRKFLSYAVASHCSHLISGVALSLSFSDLHKECRFEMPRNFEKSDLSWSELKDYEYKKYNQLKKGDLKVEVSETAYRCPFCRGKKETDYLYKELLQHASDVVRSRSRGAREKAQHLALEKYVSKYLVVKDRSQLEPGTSSECLKITDHQPDQLLVYPWVGIVANIKTQRGEDGRCVGESGSKLRDEFRSKGFNPLKVHPLWSRRGHSGFAVVEFNKDWAGFKNAIMFEKSFEVDHHGKKDFYAVKNLGDKLYGWIARDDDYNSKSLIGDHLRKNGDLKTVSGKEAEDQRKTSTLVTNLTRTLEVKDMRYKEMEMKYLETSTYLDLTMEQMDEMNKSRNEEIRKMQQSAHDHFQKIYLEHEKATSQLEARKKQLEEREKQLQYREAKNETERKKLHSEKIMNERATLEQKKADEKVWRLAQVHKEEKEKLRRKIIELQKGLDAKQALELEIEQKRGTIQVMKHMREENVEVQEKMDAIIKEIKEKEQEMDAVEALNQSLIVRERKSNDELQEARKELINSLKEGKTRATIGVKRMGEIDNRPFLAAAKAKFPAEEVEEKGVELCSLWEEYLRDPNWHPFKILVDKEGNCKEIIDVEDQKLKSLKNEYGEEVHNAVALAQSEMNQYNPSGRYTIPELWNFEENRKATLKEGAIHLLSQWRVNWEMNQKVNQKRKRN